LLYLCCLLSLSMFQVIALLIFLRTGILTYLTMSQQMPSNPMRFYSRFSLQKSQPYMLTPEFDKGAFSAIPGTQWVPDFSMWQVNNPDFPSGPERQPVTNGPPWCSTCKRFVGSNGFVFWKTREFYGDRN